MPFFRVGRPFAFFSHFADEASRGKTYFFPFIYLPHLRCEFPCSFWALACLAALPTHIRLMRFLFVRPKVCLLLPSDSTSRWTPLLLAMHFPLPGVLGTFTHKKYAMLGAPKKQHPYRMLFSRTKER